MFNDSLEVVVGFNHIENRRKGKRDVSCQFTGVSTENKSCSTTNVKTTETQTDEIKNIDVGNVDALKDCLEKGLRVLETKCDEWPSLNSYHKNVDEDINNHNVIEVPLKQHPSFGMKKVSALCWNCSGDKLMIATGEFNHTHWCNHINSVFVYSAHNLEQCTVANILETTSCVTRLSAHPTNKHLITAGLYNGELLICNTNDNMATISFEWHSEAIIELLWFVKCDQQIILVTAGKDGFVCIGTMMDNKIKFTQRICRYLVGVPEKIGIQCFDYSDRHFLVALENGIISSYLCEITRNLKDDNILKAVKVKTYNGCALMVENIKFGYKNSNKFVITQFDNTILLYDIHQKNPQKMFFNRKLITKFCWSLDSEFILYVGEESGVLAKINLINEKTDSIKQITTFNLTLMNINPIRKNIIAVSTLIGEIYLIKYK